ncbi:uncharacterized protein F4807DRAFT_206319 [Annulohypoxylon truncatum]|uniref:uncharacterized protein n=1 Tax=Annulohypoxylon truncatum TaxID=327061 RepID=UPI002007BBFD|nr:uncharacterized protein F4807DRAFT_206319 [Annulohypoxylon truncatum]KAI1213941.1 hypothetical protein F4807DRAFT_206319 [Annulohypoxylon truncatum]
MNWPKEGDWCGEDCMYSPTGGTSSVSGLHQQATLTYLGFQHCGSRVAGRIMGGKLARRSLAGGPVEPEGFHGTSYGYVQVPGKSELPVKCLGTLAVE